MSATLISTKFSARSATRRQGRVRSLARRETWSHSLREGGTAHLRVTSGLLWVTFEGDAEDHALAADDSRSFRGPGLLVAEGIGGGAEFECA